MLRILIALKQFVILRMSQQFALSILLFPEYEPIPNKLVAKPSDHFDPSVEALKRSRETERTQFPSNAQSFNA